jgi:hypothetical protein
MASPLAAFLRVPLAWYHATTISFFPDETSAQIHRAYTHPHATASKRHFCGFCGTPLSFWSEEPAPEADYIHLTLGSLCAEDLSDLEELGLRPDLDDGLAQEGTAKAAPQRPADADGARDDDKSPAEAAAAVVPGRETTTPSWLDTLVAGSRLAEIRRTSGSRESKDGRIKLRWEVVEWTESSDENSPVPTKRKLGDREDGDQQMQGLQ